MTRLSDQAMPKALPLLEEAVHLLRRAGWPILWIHAAGTVPFCLALLAFWARITRKWMPPEAVAWEALALVPLYLVMKTAQAEFCRRLLAQRLSAAPEPQTWRGWARLAASQLRTQPWALAAVGAGAATLVPLPWALAYGQNLSVLGAAPDARRDSAAQSAIAPGQNVTGLLLLALIFLAGWINLYAGCSFFPRLLNRLAGLDNVFSHTGLSFFNSTFLAASLIMAWVAFDPLLKAFYLLRIFYGRSLHTGEDLRVDLRWARVAVGLAIAAGLLLGMPGRASAASQPAPAPLARTVSVAGLDRAIASTLSQPQFTGLRHAPERESNATDGPGPIGRFFLLARDQAGEWLTATGHLFGRIWRWIFPPDPSGSRSGASGARSSAGAAIYVLLGAAGIAVLALAMLVSLQIRRNRLSVATGRPPPPVEPPNLEAEGIDASRLPPAGWLGLARDQASRGEWRLALRAAYLATLAQLAARDFILLARAKTNLDYERELRRRAAARAEVVEQFILRRSQFEAVWYGAAVAGPAEVSSWIEELERSAGS